LLPAAEDQTGSSSTVRQRFEAIERGDVVVFTSADPETTSKRVDPPCGRTGFASTQRARSDTASGSLKTMSG